MSMNWVWPIWIGSIIASFGFLEGWAIVHDQPTLSHWTWEATKAWPPLAVVYGLIFGGLAVHLFWPNQGLARHIVKMLGLGSHP